MPWVRSGSSESGISLSSSSGESSASVSVGAFDGSEGVEFCEGGGVLGWYCRGGFDGGVELELELESGEDGGGLNLGGGVDGGGFPALAMPLLHMFGAADKAGDSRRVEGEEAHLEMAAG